MSLETLTIELVGDGYQYIMKPLRGVDESQDKPALSISVPGRSAANNILLGIQGQQGEITVQFFLHNDGTDKSNGTAPTGDFTDDTVVTIAEQREWLRDYVHSPDFDVQHTLTHDTGNEYSSMDVYLENINIPTLQQDSPKWTQASMRLRRGGPV